MVLKASRAVERTRNGKDLNPPARIADFQSKTTEKVASRDALETHSKGYDTHKHAKGQKRHLLVNALGRPLSKRL